MKRNYLTMTSSHPVNFKTFNISQEVNSKVHRVVEDGINSFSYETLLQKIDSLFDSSYEANNELLLNNIILCIGKWENRTKLVNILLNSEQGLVNIVKNSYLHHNGFRKIILLETKNFKIRLHEFEPMGKVVAQENIHDHRWPFSSVCLEGKLISEIYNLSEKGDIYFNYEYNPLKGKEHYSTKLIGLRPLNKTATTEVACGSGYYMPDNKLHRIINHTEQKVVTLIITGPMSKETCNLFSESEYKEGKHDISRFTREQIVQSLIDLKNYCKCI